MKWNKHYRMIKRKVMDYIFNTLIQFLKRRNIYIFVAILDDNITVYNKNNLQRINFNFKIQIEN